MSGFEEEFALGLDKIEMQVLEEALKAYEASSPVLNGSVDTLFEKIERAKEDAGIGGG